MRASGRFGISIPQRWHLTLSPSLSRATIIVPSTGRIGQYLAWERWRRPALLGFVVLNLILIADLLSWPGWRQSVDWTLWRDMAGTPDPYHVVGATPFRYSPVSLWTIGPLVTAIGPIGLMVAHFAVLFLMPRRIGLLVAISFPFWMDLLYGNVFAFVFVAAFWAMRGNRLGTVAFIALTLLMPRPVQLPLLAWLLWKDPWARWAFAGLFAVHGVLVLWSGLAPTWVSSLLSASGAEMAMSYNFGPTRLIGYAWFVVGIPLGLYLFRKHPGWAGLAISPYLLGQYWLMAGLWGDDD